jgi:hypothetical protein
MFLVLYSYSESSRPKHAAVLKKISLLVQRPLFASQSALLTALTADFSAQPSTPAEGRALNRGIAASEKDYREGSFYGPFKTHEAFVAVLRQEAGKLNAKKNKRTLK